MPEYRIPKTDAPPPGKGRTLEIDGHDVALYNVNGIFFATDDFCKHRGGHLGEGELSDACVICPDHGWRYDVKSGKCLSHPNGDVRAYPVRVEGDHLILTADPSFVKLF